MGSPPFIRNKKEILMRSTPKGRSCAQAHSTRYARSGQARRQSGTGLAMELWTGWTEWTGWTGWTEWTGWTGVDKEPHRLPHLVSPLDSNRVSDPQPKRASGNLLAVDFW